MIRGAVPSLVPFLVSEFGFSPAQRATLLASFFPGYVISHVPAGWAVQKFGGLAVLTVNMLGTAACCALLVLVGRLRLGAARCASALSATLFVMGLFQVWRHSSTASL